MSRLGIRQILKYAILGSIVGGTFLSLKANEYQLNSIGIVRLTRATVTVFGIALTYNRKLYKSGITMDSLEYEEIKSCCHQQAADKLLELCRANGGVYIKVGQYIGALDYLLPSEYVQTMKILHSQAPPNKLEDVYKVIKEDLKQDPRELFSNIDPEPLGTASLAQVHKAILKDGTTVAVKVQHRYVQGNARIDVTTMDVLVKLVSWVFPEFKFRWLVNETKRNLPQELNFEQEAHNAEKVARMYQHFDWFIVPKIRWEYTTSRVLTMEFVEGGQVNDIDYIRENNIDPFEVTDKLSSLYSQMIFINGFVHSDPHPGNILLKKTTKGTCDIIFLDHGLYATLTDEFRVEYAKLWLSILNRDLKAMRLHSNKFGIKEDLYDLFACVVTGRTWNTVLEGVDRQRETKEELELMQKQFPIYLPQVSGILEDVDRQMLLIFKTNELMRGIEHTLSTSSKMRSFRGMSKCCIRTVYKEKIENASSKIDKIKITLMQYWLLFKINLYYAILFW